MEKLLTNVKKLAIVNTVKKLAVVKNHVRHAKDKILANTNDFVKNTADRREIAGNTNDLNTNTADRREIAGNTNDFVKNTADRREIAGNTKDNSHTDAALQTKEWRKSQTWYKTGKSNECEKYQIEFLEKLFKKPLIKTNDRINMETLEIVNTNNISNIDNGYELSENFDKMINTDKKYYFNLKFTCDKGGAQTRTLREVYHFIKMQLNLLLKKSDNLHFINILDGDECYKNMHKFNYLLNKLEYTSVKSHIFIGSMYDFHKSSVFDDKVEK